MLPADRQDVAIKVTIVALGIFVLAVVVSGWYYEAAVIIAFGILAWLISRKIRRHHKGAVVAVAVVGLAATVATNRLVTHEIVVENMSGRAISHLFVSGWATGVDQLSVHLHSLAVGERHTASFRSLWFDGELQIQVTFPDGSYFEGSTRGLQDKYRRRSRVVVRQGGKIETVRY